ncbi:hypothetical protein VNO78_27750 [Psophocarpus tetragonolobus]|uniref:Uncharacterized protein n=1 Tax=Psophocarpus tetragonolobus TaxID=3891 RepID=A0AAN9XAF2_PSOTE
MCCKNELPWGKGKKTDYYLCVCIMLWFYYIRSQGCFLFCLVLRYYELERCFSHCIVCIIKQILFYEPILFLRCRCPPAIITTIFTVPTLTNTKRTNKNKNKN